MPIAIDRYEAIAEEVLAIYEEAEMVMMRKVAKRLQRGVKDPGWTERKYGEMQDVSKELRAFLSAASKERRRVQMEGLEKAYTESRDAFLNEPFIFTTVTGIQGLTANTEKVTRIIAELDATMDAADRHILRTAQDAYSDIVGHVSSVVATGSITYREAVKRELSDFADRGITSFVDKAGRRWDMETYSEMATLTAIERATREGYTDAMQEFGYDLAIISDHYGACPVCEAWQGVVISINGTTPGYHTLSDAEAAGVFHPRCMHDFSVYHDTHTGVLRGPGGVQLLVQTQTRARKEPRPVRPANPGYSARSEQRGLERQVRKWKRRMAVSADPEDERVAYARVRMYQSRIKALVDAYNDATDSSIDHLPRKYWREGGRVKLSAAARRLAPIQLTFPASGGNIAVNGRTGLNLQLFAEADLKKQTVKQLRSGIDSFHEEIALHRYKISHPAEFYADWDDVSDNIKSGRLRHWQKEIRNFEKSIKSREDEIASRSEE